MALVGAIGGGKSEVLRRIERAGFPVFSADAAAAALYQPGADGWTWLRRRFGERFTPSDDAPVDKKALLAAMLHAERNGEAKPAGTAAGNGWKQAGRQAMLHRQPHRTGGRS